MASVASHHAASMQIAALHPGAATLVLTWSISRTAARACGLVERESGPAVRLEVSGPAPGGEPATIRARVLDGDRTVAIDTPHRAAAWIRDSIRGVWHLDIDGLLKLTIRQEGGRVEALYARTELLAQAGVEGGRYEFEGAAFRG